MSSDNKAQIAVDKFLQFTDGEVASFFEACVHCGECAEACHFYMATKDPKYTPTYKLFPMVKAYKREKAPLHSIRKMFGLLPPAVTEDELREWETLVYDSCTMCGRCTMVCPMGIDIAGTIRKMREGYAAADIVPDGLRRSVDFVEKTGSPMGVTSKALLAQVKHQEKETGIKIEIDKQGADYMAILSSMEIMGFPEIIGAYAKIFKKAGVSWTISTKAYEATNVGVQIGSGPLAKEIVTRVVDAAEELGVKYVISPECGHAYGAIRWAGPNMVGRPFKFEVVHIIELLDQLRREGKIPAGDKDGRKMTLHDPCQIIRRGGLLKEPRRLLDESCADFVEMENAGLGNLCCGGGGGVSANPRAAELQNAAFGCKADQLKAIDGLEAVVVPCANCRTVFEEGLEEREMYNLEVLGLGELVAETLKDIEQAKG
ncbi:MAG TPA: (Fe-S)-binding protein [Rhodobacteraceae bacterium]|nr:(Fe-S)-binding protein [Paracoccaceae bacterium]